MKYTTLVEYIDDHKSRTSTINGWEVVRTKHGVEREHERHGGDLPGGHHDFMHKVTKKIDSVKTPKSGEYMYHSMKHNQAAVLNVDHEKKQLRVITVLPHGKSIPKPGTRKVMIEGVEQDVECVVLYDTEFDEAFDQFVTEEMGMSLDDVLTESDGRATYAFHKKEAALKGQAALDDAHAVKDSTDHREVSKAIASVSDGIKAHRAAATAARQVQYPGHASPWAHHDERVTALTKLHTELSQRHKKMAK